MKEGNLESRVDVAVNPRALSGQLIYQPKSEIKTVTSKDKAYLIGNIDLAKTAVDAEHCSCQCACDCICICDDYSPTNADIYSQ